MSDSDSDLDFESADEDTTEHDISEKEKVSETISTITEYECTVTSTGCVQTDVAPKLSTPSRESDCTKSLTDNLAKHCIVDETHEIKESSAPAELKESSAPAELKESSAPAELKESTVDVKIKQEKQRIPLRRERKMQQKSQPSKRVSEEESISEDKCISVVDAPKQPEPPVSEEKTSSWGFSSWGSSLLSTAASSVSTLSSQVSQGIGSVFETVESTLGAPSPEELASALKERREESNESSDEKMEAEEEIGLGILPGMSAWTKALENTGSKVFMGGLDTLELIGKKTMDILTEGDPGLRAKRNLFSDRVNLSQILREAKEKADKESENNSISNADVIHYSQIFDDQQGLVHLEALEMLSKQTQAKFQRLLMQHSRKEEIKKRVKEIKSICENIPDLDDPSESEGFNDFESVFKKHVMELNLPLNVDNIVKTQRQLCGTFSKFEDVSEKLFCPPDEIYRSSICSLAEFTARCIETFHKVAELILVQKNLSLIEESATNLTGLTTVMCIEINNLSSKYHKCLDSSGGHFPNFTNDQGLNITAMVTNLYVEASNSNKYIQDAFQMLVPVLQVCLLESLEN